MNDTATASEAQTIRLVGWGTFDELRESIRALLYGEMVKRAIPVVKEFHSDLFHDATWIKDNVNGEMGFDYMVRHSGTNIGESARIQQSIGAPGGVLYRVVLSCDLRGEWSATFVPLLRVREVF